MDAIIRELCECQSTLKDTERVIKDHTNTIDSLIREGIESKSQLLKLEQDNKDISRRMDCILCNRQSEFVNQWRIVNLICQEYLEEESDPSMQKRMAKRFEKEMAKLRSEKSLRDIEAEVNAVFDNLISYFKKEMGNVSEEDRTMMVLLAAGFTPKAITWILGIKLKTLYTRRARLTRKIEDSGAPHKEDFLKVL